ncbi:MAG: hypothetical protein N3A66_11355, partial [Planctomycetota bacterium]|nr:hypothetical protein [Planctomycetota bacterium]
YIKDAYAFFKDTCAQMHGGWIPEGPMEKWPEQFPPHARVVLETSANTLDEAKRLAERLRRICGEYPAA